jgi:hypothetical protein
MSLGRLPRLVMGMAIPREAGASDSASGGAETRKESEARTKAGEMYISKNSGTLGELDKYSKDG